MKIPFVYLTGIALLVIMFTIDFLLWPQDGAKRKTHGQVMQTMSWLEDNVIIQ